MSADAGAGEEFREILKQRARGPTHRGELDPALCERAMELILSGAATPAQIGGFLLVGRAVGDSAAEMAAYTRPMLALARTINAPSGPPVVSVTGGFDGKLRTFNVGVAASLVAAAAGGRMLLLGGEGTPPKAGRTVFETLRGLGISAPQSLPEAESFLQENGFAATSVDHYLPELHALLGLRWEMARRTVLSVCEKMVSPVRDTRWMIGVSHRPFLETVSQALTSLGVQQALVYQAIEGSDEAPLDGSSSLVRVRGGEIEEFSAEPESLGLPRATKAHIPWQDSEDEAQNLLAALRGEGAEPVRALILYNAALRLWMGDPGTESSLADHLKRAGAVLDAGEAIRLLESSRRAVTLPG
ncbi:MAG TPA: hypothetical protein VHM16_07670 [Rubrobacteraceae bacterium]|nr:hypothetical protein [Rubrobacteraceae bacterium]